MPELIVTEKLQPCLLDRLADDDPKNPNESRSQRVVPLQRYRQGVLRDLEWLFGASAHLTHEGTDNFTLEDFPFALKSVINFGIRHLFGISSPNLGDLQRELTDALYIFEPRIIPNSLKIRAQKRGNIITLDVQAELWANPVPEHLHFKTKLDIEGGYASLGT
jgi:type VI secretion system protein ImpF